MVSPLLGFKRIGTCKGREKELIPFLLRYIDTMSIGSYYIKTLLVVIVTKKVRLS